ncbi:SsgA family sporulation/cell division regulator [Streptomyces sp. NPDC057950]|uniref:SsgA family sporulation/cell division regulator n=1 Tax=Streptomyces sp. NPDC057950 TaxID=3346288 RepID=UPI0036E17F6B
MPYQQSDLSAHKGSAYHTHSLRLQIHRILGPSVRIPLGASFHYTEADPLAVRVELHTPEGPVVRWAVSRDLLYDGTEEPSGMGDVRLWPSLAQSHRVVCMRLEAGGLSCLFEIDLRRLQDWLVETFAMVHPGTEFGQMDWDLVLEVLTDGKGGSSCP